MERKITLRVLAIGDLVGENGVKKLKETLPKIREQEKILSEQSIFLLQFWKADCARSSLFSMEYMI